MTKIILRIYDLFKKSPVMTIGLFLIITGVLVASVLTLSYKEDISDFLPLDEENQTALAIYQDISGANKIYAIISDRNDEISEPDSIVEAVKLFVENVEKGDSIQYLSHITHSIDMEKMTDVINDVYENIPYFLTDSDYSRIDSLLNIPGFVTSRLLEDKQLLMFPSSGMVGQYISKDPLNLFTPVIGRLQTEGMSANFEIYDGYILTPDGRRAIVILESSFGAHESENNAKLVEQLKGAVAETQTILPDIDIHLIGGPVVAVSNSNQIKSDSILAVCIAGILILFLLIYVFRNLWNILLIIISVGWGWLFAMGAIALYYSSVSIIVIGIASVILGIAVNYPLHLIDHLQYSSHPRNALKEIISPLIIGNVTTVGAFLCLVPLNAPALHDLGLFSSLLLIGTILFVLIFLPQIVRTRRKSEGSTYSPTLITRLANVSLEGNKYVVVCILLLTGIFGYFSLKTEFDSDMRNINYMTEQQKSDMTYFQTLFSARKDAETLYIVSNGASWDEALTQNENINITLDSLERCKLLTRNNSVSSFLSSKQLQYEKLEKWNRMINRHKILLTDSLRSATLAVGFNPTAFEPFESIVNADYKIKEFTDFENLISSLFAGNLSKDETTGRHSLVQTVEVPLEEEEHVKDILSKKKEFGAQFFDVKSMNGSIANTLSNDFNYIGIACGCIVFIFLWLSFGSIELAIVSFLPMAISWIWILGIMGLLDIKFNIVNVILATFIFGQGDDYTIFITEGLTYEFAYRKKLLASYKSSIIVSALIMFIGIGTLIFAKHPALRSLGEVTVVGMLSVVIMAYLFPPLVFNWLVKCNEKRRYQPITLKSILCAGLGIIIIFLQIITGYIAGTVMFIISKPSRSKRLLFRCFISSCLIFDLEKVFKINLEFIENCKEDDGMPAFFIANNRTILDLFCLMSLSPKAILVCESGLKLNTVIFTLLKWSDFLIINDDRERTTELLKPLISEGYGITLCYKVWNQDDNETEVKNNIEKALQIAQSIELDLIPVSIVDIPDITPKFSLFSVKATKCIKTGERITGKELSDTVDISTQAKILYSRYTADCRQLYYEFSNLEEFIPIVFQRYIYKGRDIEVNARKTLKVYKKSQSEIQGLSEIRRFYIYDKAGQGELALLLALLYPESTIYCILDSPDKREILKGCIEDFITNVHDVEFNEIETSLKSDSKFFEVLPGYYSNPVFTKFESNVLIL